MTKSSSTIGRLSLLEHLVNGVVKSSIDFAEVEARQNGEGLDLNASIQEKSNLIWLLEINRESLRRSLKKLLEYNPEPNEKVVSLLIRHIYRLRCKANRVSDFVTYEVISVLKELVRFFGGEEFGEKGEHIVTGKLKNILSSTLHEGSRMPIAHFASAFPGIKDANPLITKNRLDGAEPAEPSENEYSTLVSTTLSFNLQYRVSSAYKRRSKHLYLLRSFSGWKCFRQSRVSARKTFCRVLKTIYKNYLFRCWSKWQRKLLNYNYLPSRLRLDFHNNFTKANIVGSISSYTVDLASERNKEGAEEQDTETQLISKSELSNQKMKYLSHSALFSHDSSNSSSNTNKPFGSYSIEIGSPIGRKMPWETA